MKRKLLLLSLVIAAIAPATTIHAQVTWDAGAGTSSWGDANNWSTNALPGASDTVLFSGVSPLSISLNGDRSVSAVWFSGTSNYIVSGNTLTLSDSSAAFFVQSPSSGTVTDKVNSAVSMTGTSAVVAVASDATLLLTGVVSSTGLLDKINFGTLTVTNTVTAGGGVRIQAGGLRVGNGTTGGSITGDISLTGSTAALTFNRSDDSTYAGVISGSQGSISKSGTGTLSLTGDSTHTGTLSINGGTVDIGGGGATGGWAGDIINNSVLAFDRTTASTFSGVISGSGNLRQDSAGTLTLTGTSTMTGAVHINGGTLELGNGGTTGSLDDASSITVAAGAALAINRSDVVVWSRDLSGAGGFTMSGSGYVVFNASQSYTGATVINDGVLQVGGGNTSGGISSSSAISVGSGGAITFSREDDVVVSNVFSGTGAISNVETGSTLFTGTSTFTGSVSAQAGTLQIGNSATSGWIPASSFNSYSGAKIIFARSDAVTITGSVVGSGAYYFGDGGTYTLSGSVSSTGSINVQDATIALTGSSVSMAALNTSLGAAVSFGSGTTANVTAMTLGGTVSGGTDTVTINSGAAVTTTGAVTLGNTSGTNGTVNVSGGTWTASGTIGLNTGTTATGAINVTNGGTFSTNNLSGTAITVTLDNGTFTNTASGTYGPAWTLGSGGGTFNTAANATISSVIGGTGAMTKSGTATLTLTGTNTDTATLTISAGTVQIGNGGTTGVWAGNITNNSALIFNRSDALTYSSIISGSGTVTKTGVATLTLTGANTDTGTLTNGAGSVQIGNGGTAGAWAGNIANSGTLIFDRSDTLDFAGVISGTGSVTQNGGATVRLAGDNTFTGTLTISSGNVAIGAGGSTGSIATASVVNSGTLIFNRTTDYTYGGVISGSGGVYKVASNTLTLTGTETYTGSTTVSDGTLLVKGSISGSVTVQTGATLGGDGTVGALTVQSGGTVAPGASTGTLDTGAFTLASGATLSLELGGKTSGSYDALSATGAVSLTGSASISLFGGYSPQVGDIFYVILNDGADAVSGAFSNAPLASPAFTANGMQFQVNYAANGDGGTVGNDVALTVIAVPEPGSTMLVGVSLLVLVGRRARHSRNVCRG